VIEQYWNFYNPVLFKRMGQEWT